MSLTILLLIMGQWLLRQRRFIVTYLLSRYKWRSSFYWDSFLNAFTLVKSAHQREWVYHAVLYTHTCTLHVHVKVCYTLNCCWPSIFFQNFKIFFWELPFSMCMWQWKISFKFIFMSKKNEKLSQQVMPAALCVTGLYGTCWVWSLLLFLQIVFHEPPESFTLDDGYQSPLVMTSQHREVLAATFYKFLLKNIGK